VSKVLRTVAVVAGAVALVATGVGAFAVAGTALAATARTVATIATVVAGVASLGAAITAPKPVPRGSITQVIIAPEPPRPYIIGRSYFAGVMRHQTAYGPTLNKIPNPFLWQVLVYCGVSVTALVQPQFDFAAIGSYYSGFYGNDSQLGATPESTALVPPLNAPAPNWTSAHKLSGNAAIGWNFKFDKDQKRFASGIPVTGAIWDGVKVYDPRLDSTRAGGSGSHRVDDETTWTFSANPALHAATYAYGRYQGDTLVFGIGIPDDGIDWQAVAAWANDCDTNDWEASGVIFEGGPDAGAGQRKRNLDDICAAGAGRWLMAGAVLSFDWQRPRVPLATFTDADIDEEGGDLVTLQSFRDRFNTVRPQYTDPDSNWQLITAEKIAGSTYVTEDGQEKARAYPLNLVSKAEQAGQIATYAMADSREIGPITMTFGPEWRQYKPGDCLRWESDETGLESDLVIVSRVFDPSTLKVTFTFKGETAGKHAFALGETAVPPPTAIIGLTGEERDNIVTETVVNPDIAIVAGGARVGREQSNAGTADNDNWQNILTLVLPNSPAGRVNLGGGEALSSLTVVSGTGTADFEARLQLDGVTINSVPSQNFVTGGVISFVDVAQLFAGTHAITSGDRTFAIDLRRTSGTGTISETLTILEVVAISS